MPKTGTRAKVMASLKAPGLLAAFVLLIAAAPPAEFPAPSAWGEWSAWGDQGDGTYRNPVLPADYSDIDAIRVGDDYYAISSTIHVSPGMAVLHSKDLVNWRTVSHVVPDLTAISPSHAWDRPQKTGRVVWAGTIRHHAGKFWVFFGDPDEGLYVSTATNPAGPWSPLHPLLKGPGWNDTAALFDEDGKAYFLANNFANGYRNYIFPMSSDGRSIDRDKGVLIHEGSGREAAKMIKVDGWYYIIYSEAIRGRYVLAKRSRSPMGPYSEGRQIAEVSSEAHEPNQGGIIQAHDGNWYFLTHHGRQDWEGRAMSLLPVTWTDGWPVIGAPTTNGRGTMTWGGAIPRKGQKPAPRIVEETFSAKTLSPEWEWMHNPRFDHWSLSARRGFMRLKAWQPARADNPLSAGNILTQRAFRTGAAEMTAKIDLGGMADGQHAGLGHFSNTYAYIGLRQTSGVRTLEYRRAGQPALSGPVIPGKTLWLRANWGLDGRTTMAWSTDGRTFTPFGDTTQQTRASYRGSRVGVFTYNDDGDRGYVDVDEIRYDYSR